MPVPRNVQNHKSSYLLRQFHGSARYAACFNAVDMLWTSFVAILTLWCVAIATSFTLSGLIHLLPVCAAAVAFVGRMQARDLI